MASHTIFATPTNTIPTARCGLDANKLTLVQRARQGDRDAFAELFELHRRRVYGLCLSMTKEPFEAEDMTQETFLQVFRRLTTFRGDSAFSTWVYRVAINTVLMKRRRRNCPPMLSLDEPVSPDSPSLQREFGKRDLNLSGAIDRISLHRAIQALPAGCRRIFGLHEVHGYQHREIAALLHCSIGNSKSQLSKAKLKMRGLLFPKWSSAMAATGNRQIGNPRQYQRVFSAAINSTQFEGADIVMKSTIGRGLPHH